MSRTFHFIGNLKANPVSTDSVSRYLDGLREALPENLPENVSITIAAPSIYLERFVNGLPKRIVPAAQDVFWESDGSYTGQITTAMLSDLGVHDVIIGHGERRTYGHETDEEAGRKVAAALSAGIRPVICVGETSGEREEGKETDIVVRQLAAALHDVHVADFGKIRVAYEPRWAIGTDRIPSSNEILEARIVIRRALADCFGTYAADGIPILYGGSVKASLLEETCFRTDMDGVLVGRESLNPHEVAKMLGMMGKRSGGFNQET